MRRRIFRGWNSWSWVYIGVVVLSAYLACRLSPLAPIDLYVLSSSFAHRHSRVAPSDVVIVDIPRRMVDAHKREKEQGTAPCNCETIARDKLAAGIDALREAGASVIVLDLFFDTTCPVHDRVLSAAMNRAGNVVVSLCSSGTGGEDQELFDPPATITGYRALASPLVSRSFDIAMHVQAVQFRQRSGAQAPGRAVLLEGLCLPLSLAAVALWRGADPSDVKMVSADQLEVGGERIPVLKHWRPQLLGVLMPKLAPEEGEHAFLINWYGRKTRFRTVQFDDLLSGRYPPDSLRNAIAIVGSAEEDPHLTPLGMLRGAQIHAHATATALEQRWVLPLSDEAHWLIILLAAAVAALLMARLGSLAGTLAVGAEVLLIILAGRVLLDYDRWLLVAAVAMGTVTSGLATSLVDRARQIRHSSRLAAEMGMRDEVASEVVHDIRSHLNIISVMVERLLRHIHMYPELQTDPEVMRVIRRQLKALDAEASTLLDSDPDRPIIVHARTFPVRPMLEELADDLRASTHRHRIEVDGQDLDLYADPHLLQRAVINLLHNAVKYSPEGGVVEIGVDVEPDWIALRVRDEGIGIAADKIPLLFKRFARAVPEGYAIPGTGLGLYSAKRCVEAHGGVIDVDSLPGVGTTFTIRLPRRTGRPAGGAEQDEEYSNSGTSKGIF